MNIKVPKINSIKQNDPDIFSFVDNELKRQNEQLELIASENFVSRDILEVVGSILTNKYAEGYPGKRYYDVPLPAKDDIANVVKKNVRKL